MPSVPGFNPVWDYQPVITETLRAHGVATAYVSDNPVLQTPRFPELRTTTPDLAAGHHARRGSSPTCWPSSTGSSAATAAPLPARHRRPCAELRRPARPFFLGVDPFLPEDAFEAPRVYVEPDKIDKRGSGPWTGGSRRCASRTAT